MPDVGRGIFAGVNYSISDIIEESVSLVFESDTARKGMLFNYVYALEDIPDKSLVSFGVGMLYNHELNFVNVKIQVSSTKLYFDIDAAQSIATSAHLNYVPLRNIQVGSEIISNYGDISWFTRRNTTQKTLNIDFDLSYSLKYLQKNGICLTNIYMDESLIPHAGRGIFSRIRFLKDEIISISPVLFMKHSNIINDKSVLYNYCYNITNNSDILMLPIGLLALANHRFPHQSNARIDWYETTMNQQKITDITIESLLSSSYAPLDIVFRATRDIEIREEITINYGLEWQRAYAKYETLLHVWKWNQIGEKPIFRHNIHIPQSMHIIEWEIESIQSMKLEL